MGPAGIGMAMSLGSFGKSSNTVCFERGSHINSTDCYLPTDINCTCTKTCNIISGIGGASTLSNGKLSNYPAGSGLLDFFDSEQQLRELLDNTIHDMENYISINRVEIDTTTISAAESYFKEKGIIYKYYDVYEFNGNDYKEYVQNIVQKLKQEGLSLYENAEITSISRDTIANCFCVKAKTMTGEECYYIHNLILATGALDIENNISTAILEDISHSFEIGVRIEAPSNAFGNILLSHGDLKLKAHNGRTYCVTQHGSVISYRTGGLHFLEGSCDPTMFTDYSNLAVLIKTDELKQVADFINIFHKKYNGIPIKQRYVDYICQKVSPGKTECSLTGALCGNINDLLPHSINTCIRQFIDDVIIDAMGVSSNAITILAPELKIVNRLELDSDFKYNTNLYIIGAATGRFRGILQAMCSGIRCGQLITRR